MRTLFLSIVLLFANLLYGQDFDKLMVNRPVDCSDISYNSGVYFLKYLQEGKIDSAQSIIRYWEEKCGEREPVFRAKILLALNEGTYTDSLLNEGTMSHIYNYKSRMDMIRNSSYYTYDEYKSYFGFTPPGQEFDQETQAMAKSLSKKYNPGSTEYILAEFYSGAVDSIFLRLQNGPEQELLLAEKYNAEVERYLKKGEFHMAWITGVWLPTGDLTTLGAHPELGFQMGAKRGKMNYDFTLLIKFLSAANEYTAYRDKTPEITDDFFGGYIGVDVGRDIYANNGHEFQLTGGIALDGFDALEGDEDLDIDPESTFSYNFNFGLGYRYYVTNSFYIGLKAKYNIVDYSINDVTDFKSNPVTIHLTIGGVNNIFRNSNLKALGYKLRK